MNLQLLPSRAPRSSIIPADIAHQVYQTRVEMSREKMDPVLAQSDCLGIIFMQVAPADRN